MKQNLKALFLCLVFSMAALISWYWQNDFFSRTKVTTGRIVRLTYGPYKADAVFDVDQKQHRILVSSLRRFEVGDSVEIRYDPAEPNLGNHGAELNEFLSLWGFSSFLTLCAVFSGLRFFLMGSRDD